MVISTMGHGGLVRAVRALDQGDIETLPGKLRDLEFILINDRAGRPFHAAEEMLLRWLLKNMTGNTPNAERVRRYPQTWMVLKYVLWDMPHFTLAKSLADRKFIAVLQQTLKEVAGAQPDAPQTNGTGADMDVEDNSGGQGDSDVEMADGAPKESTSPSLKRKRYTQASFDLSELKQVDGRLQTACAVFSTIEFLLTKCEPASLGADATPYHHMGLEHVKSLLWSSSAEVMKVLAPLLSLCNLAAIQSELEEYIEMTTWISTINTIWDLHQRSASDASDVAIHLSASSLVLLSKLTGVPRPSSLSLEKNDQERWIRDLRRFLIRNLVSPAKAAFLNRQSKEVIELVTVISDGSAPRAFAMLFDLATSSTGASGDKTSKADHEKWTQAVFDVILASLEEVSPEGRRQTVEGIMEIAAKRNVALSDPSLRDVCKYYALGTNGENWKLLLSLVKLNPGVFLATEDGQALLDQVLQKTQNPQGLSAEELTGASRFIVLLAEGYASAHDLPGFVRTWLKYLSATEEKGNPDVLWTQKELSATVSRLLESSAKADQLLDILDWLSAQGGASETLARIRILDALSAGLEQEEYIDAANTKVCDVVFSGAIHDKGLPDAVSDGRWAIAERSVLRASLEDVERIWAAIKSDVDRVLRKSFKHNTVAALKCCVAMWVANYPDGPLADEVATAVCSLVDKLGKIYSIEAVGCVSWMILESPHILSLLVKRNGELPDFLLDQIVFSPAYEEDFEKSLARYKSVVENENILNNHKLIDAVVNKAISLIVASKSKSKSVRSTYATKIGIQYLLSTPTEAIDRPQREDIMKRLVGQLPTRTNKTEPIGMAYWRPALSLMVKVMEKPTFYDDMALVDLERIGECVLKVHRRLKVSTPEVVLEQGDDLRLFDRLATLTFRQMTSGTLGDREEKYLRDAAKALATPPEESDVPIRLIIQKAFLSAIKESTRLKKKDWNVDEALLQPFIGATVEPLLVKLDSWKPKDVVPLLLALQTMNLEENNVLNASLSGRVSSLLRMSDQLLVKGFHPAAWEIRTFLATHFPAELQDPLKMLLSKDEGADRPEIDKTTIAEYVDAVVHDMDESAKLACLKDFLVDITAEIDFSVDTEVEFDYWNNPLRLFIANRLIRNIKASKPTPDSTDFSLSQAHNLLCQRLTKTPLDEFILAAKGLVLLLEQKAAALTQWNIDSTLSTVTAVCAKLAASDDAEARGEIDLIPSASHPLPWLCRLAEAVIKHHRIRLDGHFHILLAALQALLRRVVAPRPAGARAQQAAHARQFTGLVRLVCEPTDDATARSHAGGGGGQLDSDKDEAKRYAGGYMYLVLMQYVKAQFEVAVPQGVTEALEPGMYAILDVTTPEGLRIMNDAMDPAGRAMFKSLYGKYQQFGKWSGV
ncbi:nucleolar pre-ribosomal-associated protein 2 [Podospora conica]|nr:nucleolar pre-ribosomal-associated protein 2 [Schizothecium conicum]